MTKKINEFEEKLTQTTNKSHSMNVKHAEYKWTFVCISTYYISEVSCKML